MTLKNIATEMFPEIEPKEKPMKILIVDSSGTIHTRLEKLVSRQLDKHDNIQNLTEFDNLLMDVYQTSPDIIILNTYTLRGTLIESIRAIKTIKPHVKIITLTEFHDENYESLIKSAGADYFINVSSEMEKISELFSECKNQLN
jgi:DNA-binding NarL/FixJ family response regulator